MKKLTVFISLMLACVMLASCSLTELFGQAGITSPESGENTTASPYETVAVGEKLGFDGITLADHIVVNYKDIVLEVDKLPAEITDKVLWGQLNAMLDYYREKQGYKFSLITDRVTEEWDYVRVDYVGKLNGVEFEGGAAKNASILLNEENSGFIPGFAQAIIGKMPGTTFDINVTFPKDYGNTTLAGKETVFEITLHGIMQFEFGDKEVATLTSGEYTTLDSYLEYYREYLEELNDYNLLNEVYSQIWEKLEAESTVISYPDGHYLYYYNSNINYMIYQAQQLGVSYEEYMSATGQTEEKLRELAEDSVKRDMIVYYILEAEGMSVTEEEYNDAVNYYVDYYNSMGYNYKAADIENLFNTYYYPGYLKYQLAEEKAITHVYDNASIVEKPADSENRPEDSSEVTQ